jgi:serine protease
MTLRAGITAILFLLAAVAVLQRGLLGFEARAATPYLPNDTGRGEAAQGWTRLQWNFVGAYGVDAPHAWGNLRAAGAAGGAGVTVAVLDTGVAYPSDDPALPGSPELVAGRFVDGYDFIEDDTTPYDENGHGTHVASTIAEETDNASGLTGLAYGVSIMPVRVLDRNGDGDAPTIARGVRFAVENGADVINLSLNFEGNVGPAQLEDLLAALAEAHEKGVLVVAGAGNAGSGSVSYPALGRHVVAVGATTDDGCLASYSNHGTGLDLVAPGGGDDANIHSDPSCRFGSHGPPVYQVTLAGHALDRFEIEGISGTSMAAPHVSAVAALVIASRVIGTDPSPEALESRLEQTARDLGSAGRDGLYGWGLVNAGTATSPGAAHRPPPLPSG